MNCNELQSWCLEVGQSSYRGQQIFEWMYRYGISSFEEMSNVNKSFREYLENNCIIQTLNVEQIFPSNILVGKIVEVTKDNFLVLPFVDFKNIDYVQVVENK